MYWGDSWWTKRHSNSASIEVTFYLSLSSTCALLMYLTDVCSVNMDKLCCLASLRPNM